MTMYDFTDPKSRPLSYEFARQAHDERTRLMQEYIRSAARGIARLVGNIAQSCIGLAKRIDARRRLRDDIRAIREFDDHTLADIGLSRDALDYLLRRGPTRAGLRIAANYPRRAARPAAPHETDPKIGRFRIHDSAR
jgi:uncharacterized protein YjiS (DUF1127 family)